MDRMTALRRIRACLRLAASSNPTEAATALRHAQALMGKYGIGQAEAMGVEEAEASTRAKGAELPRSIIWLAMICARGFGAEVITVQLHRRTVVRFMGLDGVADITAYAFTVLRRQLDRDRIAHVARIRKRGDREARGENFALAWIAAVKALFPAAEISEERRLVIESAMNVRYPSATTGTGGRDLTQAGKVSASALESDRIAGYLKGMSAQLRTGIQGSATEPNQSTLALEHTP